MPAYGDNDFREEQELADFNHSTTKTMAAPDWANVW